MIGYPYWIIKGILKKYGIVFFSPLLLSAVLEQRKAEIF
jgi:hypothetical protein